MENPLRYQLAKLAGRMRPKRVRFDPPAETEPRPGGVSVVIPSRNGRELLAAQMPAIAAGLEDLAGEIIVVDNGSDDGTVRWLGTEWPRVRVEVSPEPLSFARAVNCGIAS